jgi:hypothetical protein
MTTRSEWVRAWARKGGVVAAVVAAGVVAPDVVFAQTEYEVGVGAGFLVDIPEPFFEQYCESNGAGLTGSAAWRPLSWLSLEGSAIVTGQLGGETCTVPLLAPVPVDTPILETSYDESVEGVDFFETHASLVLEPFAGSPVSPRGRLGVGWIWQKDLFNWVWGLGVRYAFGRYAVYTDVDRWNLEIPELNETVIYRSTGAREVISSETVDRAYRPWVVRFGLEFLFPR